MFVIVGDVLAIGEDFRLGTPLEPLSIPKESHMHCKTALALNIVKAYQKTADEMKEVVRSRLQVRSDILLLSRPL